MNKRVIFLLATVMLMLAGQGVVPAGVFVTPAYAASGGGEGEEGVANPEFEYYELSPLILPIISDTGVTQQVSLIVSLEMPFGKKKDVEAYSPRLADAYLQDLYGALGAGHAMMKNNVIDVMEVKRRLTEVTHKVVGQDMVHGVLLQVLQQRRVM